MRLGIQTLAAAAVAIALLAPAPVAAQAGGTPAEMVDTYSTLADGILGLKRTEENLVKSILAATVAHGHVTPRAGPGRRREGRRGRGQDRGGGPGLGRRPAGHRR